MDRSLLISRALSYIELVLGVILVVAMFCVILSMPYILQKVAVLAAFVIAQGVIFKKLAVWKIVGKLSAQSRKDDYAAGREGLTDLRKDGERSEKSDEEDGTDSTVEEILGILGDEEK